MNLNLQRIHFTLLKFLFIFCLAFVLSVNIALPEDTKPMPPTSQITQLHSLPLKNVTVEDRFWSQRLGTYRERSVPHAWQYVEGEITALRKTGGEAVNAENGTWGEANLYKVMETVAYSLAQSPDTALQQRMAEIITIAARAQQPNGYLHAYTTNIGRLPWDRQQLPGSHDGYVLGHMIQAAIRYFEATEDRSFLSIACKAADEAWEEFLGPTGKPGFCGHAELKMALIELYRITNEPKYLNLTQAFVEWRGFNVMNITGTTPLAYFQDSKPIRDQHTLEGHAVRAVFFATGVADLAIETGDFDYRLAANRFWDCLTMRRMTITGSIGPRSEHEALGEDFELPLNGYYESCGACGLADFAYRMILLEGRAEAADILERVLYNAVLHGISLDGTTTYYCNPLSDRNHIRDNCWVCCPPNITRTLLQVPRYAYAYSPTEIFINLYVGGSCTVPLFAGPVKINVQTTHPWEGHVVFTMQPEQAQKFALNLRMPYWCPGADLSINGQSVNPLPRNNKGWIHLEREWNPGDTVEFNMQMPVQYIEAHPNIRECAGRVALQRGPLVYGFEGLDNPAIETLTLPEKPALEIEWRPDFLGSLAVLKGQTASGAPCNAIPFYALANREATWQEVFITRQNKQPSSTWWEGALYRPEK